MRFVILQLLMIALCAHSWSKFEAAFGEEVQAKPDVRAWLKNLKKEANAIKQPAYHKSIQQLATLIESDGVVRMYVTQMLEEVPEEKRVFDDVHSLLNAMNLIIQRAPEFKDGTPFPMSALFADMMYTPAGEAGFCNAALNAATRNVLQEWCKFLDSRESLYVINKKDGWLSPKAWQENNLDDFVVPNSDDPNGGFQSFNEFFHRKIKAKLRPVAALDDDKTVVSANDGTVYQIARAVKKKDQFWIKSQPYSLVNMLNGMYVDRFVGGDVVQSFLGGSDYHRFHAPINGTVRAASVVDGLMFSELRSQGFDASGGTLSQGYQASVNTRGLLFIESENPKLGMVCVIPIGITEVSSVTLTVKPGQKVRKGDEVGYFSYGGSSMCLVFQPGAIERFTVPKPTKTDDPEIGPKIKVNAEIAKAN